MKIIATVALSYFCTGWVALLLAIPPGFASSVWLPAGLALAASVRFGREGVIGSYIGSLAVVSWNLLHNSPDTPSWQSILMASVAALGSATQAWFGAALIHRRLKSLALEDENDVIWVLVAGGPVSCLVAASIATLALVLGGALQISDWFLNWLTWWVGDTIGAILIAPTLLMLSAGRRSVSMQRRQWAVAGPSFLLLVAVVATFVYMREYTERERIEEFNTTAGNFESLFVSTLERNRSNLLLLRDSLPDDNDASFELFSHYAQFIRNNRNWLVYLAWVPYASAQNYLQIEQLLHRNGAVIPYIRYPSGERPDFARGANAYPLLWINDARDNAALLGLDFSNERAVKKAFEDAAQGNAAVYSAPILFPRHGETIQTIIGVAPAFDTGGGEPKLRGYLIGVVDFYGLVSSLLQYTQTESTLQIKLHDAEQYAKTKSSTSVLYTWVHQLDLINGNRLLEISALPGKDDKNWLVWSVLTFGLLFTGILSSFLLVITGRTATVQREVELKTEALQETVSKLERASRAKSEFLASMSHELRTPLNSVIGYTRRVLNRYGDRLDDRGRDALETALRNGHHLLDLINDLLDVEKIEAGQMQLFFEYLTAESLMESVVKSVEPMALEKNLKFSWSCQPGMHAFYADGKRVTQILLNLLANAVKFTEQGFIHLDAKVARRNGVDGILFSVSDSGIGISDEDSVHIFQRFSQLSGRISKRVEGSGLGLSLVKSLTELHDGLVSFDSKVGYGSTFRVWFPCNRPAMTGETCTQSVSTTTNT